MKLPLDYLKQFDKECNDIINTVDNIATTYTKQLDECIEEVQDLIKNKDD